MKKTKTWLLITGLLVICVVAVALFFPSHDAAPPSGDEAGDAATEGTFVPIDQIAPYGTQPPESPEEEHADGPVAEDAPMAPGVPAGGPVAEDSPAESAAAADESIGEHGQSKTEAESVPASEEPDIAASSAGPDESAETKEPAPKSGDKNEKGEVYIPGFGWVKDEGGGGQGEISVGEGSMDIMVGH